MTLTRATRQTLLATATTQPVFEGCDLAGASFEEVAHLGLVFAETLLVGGSLRNAHLKLARFDGADLREADISGLNQGACRSRCDNGRMEMLVITLASLFAGFVDSMVGGGGLILVPALLSTFPTAHPATLFGTNKGASVWGTGMATLQYSRRVQLPWRALLPAVLVAFVTSLCGAWLVTVVSPDYLRKILPAILLLVLGYTLARKELGRHHAPRFTGRMEAALACCIGAVIGFYDGFFGPGTGSFFVFCLVRFLGYDFLHASAAAKLLNTATNISALLLFIYKGHIWWHFALAMAVANVVGSLAGTHMALKHGTGFVRWVFIAVVSALICKTGYDAFVR